MKSSENKARDASAVKPDTAVTQRLSPENMADMNGSAYAAVLALLLTVMSALAIFPFILPKIPI